MTAIGLESYWSFATKQVIGWHVFGEGVSRSDRKLLTRFHEHLIRSCHITRKTDFRRLRRTTYSKMCHPS